MRRGVLFFVVLILCTNIDYAQGENENVRVNIELNQFVTGSGFASGSELYIKIEEDHKKTLALGIFYDVGYKKITGLSVHHDVYIFRKAKHYASLKPHLFYNLIYRKTTIPEVGSDFLANGDLATYTSMEHHFGAGISLLLSKNSYLNFDIGYGVYLGSIKKPITLNPITGEVIGGNGFGMIAQIGFGYNIF